MHKDISPEEKLLSIIKGKQNTPDSGAPRPEIKDTKPVSPSPWSKIDGYVLAVLKNDFLKNSVLNAEALRIFNKYAVVAAALVTVYLFLDIILISPSRRAASVIAKTAVSGTPVAVLAEKKMPIETKGYSHYSNRMSGKNIFRGGSFLESESQTAALDASAELPGGGLGLVGIIPGKDPQAIVEDKKNKKTYYLFKGQSINGITAEDINKNKVVLEYKGKRMTLFL